MTPFSSQPSPSVRARLTLLGPGIFACLLATPAPTPAQELETDARMVGLVVDQLAGLPAVAAEIVIVSIERRTLTNEEGWFVLDGLRPGEYVVEVRYLGLTSAEYPVYLPVGTTRVDFAISAPPFELEELVVEIQAQRTVKLQEFEIRRTRERGYFIDRETIERSAPVFISDLLRHIPNVSVEWTWEGNVRVVMGHGLSVCEPDLYIDGSPSHAARLNDWLPNLIEAIEVYNRSFDRPSAFRSEGCGAILIWTRERM